MIFNHRKKNRGILLITTLLIISLLTLLTTTFIGVNHDNLMQALTTNTNEAAIEAAYAGINYAVMRFEEDSSFGQEGTTPSSSTTNTLTNGTVTKYAAFPDNNPAAQYWGAGGTVTTYTSAGFTVIETGATVVGVLRNNDSHFQVHFQHTGTSGTSGAGYSTSSFDDSSIAAHGAGGGWNHSELPAYEHSLNNLGNGSSAVVGGKTIPPYSARLVSVGYSHGTIRVAEALVRRIFATNSSIQSGKNITVNLATGAGVTGNETWNISSVDYSMNNIQAGVQLQSSGQFSVVGGNITGTSGSGHIALNQISFAGSNNTQGAAYALMSPLAPSATNPTNTNYTSYGQVTLDQSYPTAPTTTSPPVTSVTTKDGSGTFYAEATDQFPVPTQQLNANNILSQTGTTTTCDIPAGVYAFRSNCGAKSCKGDRIEVYSFAGARITAYDSNSAPACFTVNGYQLMVQPGVQLVVDSTNTTGKVTVGGTPTPQGDMMLTLSPLDFTKASGNTDRFGTVALPTLALGYQQENVLGDTSSSLDMAGNLYVQGQILGSGTVAAQVTSSVPANWLPPAVNGKASATQWGKDDASGSAWVDSTYATALSNGGVPNNLTDVGGDVFVDGNSQLMRTPSDSVALYAEGNVSLNPLPTTIATGNFPGIIKATDNSAYGNALVNYAGAPSGSGWTTPLTFTNGTSDTLNDYLNYSKSTSDLRNLLRTDLEGNTGAGLDSASSGTSADALYNGTITDPAVTTYLTAIGKSAGDSLSLYNYVALAQYQSSGDASFLRYTTPPTSANTHLDQVEKAIRSTLKTDASQASNSNLTFGNLMNSYVLGASGYNALDMQFQGLIYVKGTNGFLANPNGHRFYLDGALVTTNGNVNIQDAGEADFIFDPSQFINFYSSPPGSPFPVQLYWASIW